MKFFPHLCLLFALSACSSASKKEEEKASPRLQERLGKWDTTKRSSFDTQRKVGGVDKKYKTGLFHRKDYTQTKEFNSGKEGFKTKDFAQSDKNSKTAEKTFSGADDKNRMAEQQFKTGASRFSNQADRDADKVSRMEDDVFKTRSDPVTRKAIETSKRPYIEETSKPGYTEDEVRGILNKQ